MTSLPGHPLDPCALLEADGFRFRDLDHDGVPSPYEDPRRSPDERADDLLGRMTVEEKVGLLLHGTAPSHGPLGTIGVGSAYDVDGLEDLIARRHVHCMITRLQGSPSALADQANVVQAIAARTRLGIPVIVSSDPRHHRGAVVGAGVAASGFSVWPGPLGLGATADPDLVRTFGDVVRREYRAVGIHMALSPQADLATSPRWPRTDGTFGEAPDLVRTLVGAYVEGVQGGRGGVSADGVASVVKHWVGYGASEDGFDGHNHYGRFSAFPGGNFQDHVDAFLDAFAAGVAGVMPTYNVLRDLVVDGAPVEQTGAGFSTVLLRQVLRGTYAYDGLVLSDWGITRDLTEPAVTGVPPQQAHQIAMPWGVEHLGRTERLAACVNAGCDQIGGEDDPVPLLEAIRTGILTTDRVDEAARRVLVLMFRLGLFEQPFVDADAATAAVGTPEAVAAADDAQRRSLVVLRRDVVLEPGGRVVLHGLDPAPFTEAGLVVVDDPADATVAVVSLHAPFERLHPGFFFGNRQHEGSLAWPEDHPDLVALRASAARVPTAAVVTLDRAAVLTPVAEVASTLVVSFGAEAPAVVDALVGRGGGGRLPLQVPRSMEAVLARPPDRPAGDPDPLFPLGAGLAPTADAT